MTAVPTVQLNDGTTIPQLGVGAAIEKSGVPREELYVTTKLRVSDFKRGGTQQALEELQTQGTTRSIGVSNFLPEHLDRVAEVGSVTPAVNQVEIHPALQQRTVQDASKKYSIATQAWSPLTQGAVFGDQPILDAARTHGVTVAQVIIRWHVQRGRILLPKSVTPSRIEENFEVFGFELTESELEAINALDRNERTGADPATFNPLIGNRRRDVGTCTAVSAAHAKNAPAAPGQHGKAPAR